MKKKLTLLAVAVSLLSSSLAIAKEKGGEDNFANHKAEVITHLNQKKSAIGDEIACINSAQKKDDIEKCHEQKEEAMKKFKKEQANSRKERLQDQIKKLDNEDESGQK